METNSKIAIYKKYIKYFLIFFVIFTLGLLTERFDLDKSISKMFKNSLDSISRISYSFTSKEKIFIKGPKKLSGATIEALDVRAGAAAIVAGLIANGRTLINNINHIDRGYSTIDRQLIGLGAKIHRSKSGAKKCL